MGDVIVGDWFKAGQRNVKIKFKKNFFKVVIFDLQKPSETEI